MSPHASVVSLLGGLPWRAIPHAILGTYDLRKTGAAIFVDGKRADRIRWTLRKPCGLTFRTSGSTSSFELQVKIGPDELTVRSGQDDSVHRLGGARWESKQATRTKCTLGLHGLPLDSRIRLALIEFPVTDQAHKARFTKSSLEIAQLLKANLPISVAQRDADLARLVEELEDLLSVSCSPEFIASTKSIADSLKGAGAFASASALRWWCASYDRLVFGDLHAITVRSYGNLAIALKQANALSIALPLERLVLAVLAEHRLCPAGDLAMAHMELGNTLEDLGQIQEARLHIDESYRIAQRTPDLDTKLKEIVVSNAAATAERLGDWRLAAELMAEVLASRTMRPLDDPSSVYRTRIRISQLFLRSGEVARASMEAGLACDYFIDLLPSNPEDAVRAIDARVDAYVREGAFEAATELIGLGCEAFDGTPHRENLAHRKLHIALQSGDVATAYELYDNYKNGSQPAAHDCQDCVVELLLEAASGNAGLAQDLVMAGLAKARAHLVGTMKTATPREADDIAFEVSESLSLYYSVTGDGKLLPIDPKNEVAALEVLLLARNLPFAAGTLTREGKDKKVLSNEHPTDAQEVCVDPTNRRMLDLIEAGRIHRLTSAHVVGPLCDQLLEQSSVPSVTARLGKGHALITYHSYAALSIEANSSLGSTVGEQTIAVILREDGNIIRVDLGALYEIDCAVGAFLQAIEGTHDGATPMALREYAGRELVRFAGRELSALVFEPVLTRLPNCGHLWILAGESLSMVPFDCLTVSGLFAGEFLNLDVIASTLEVADSGWRGIAHSAVLVGGVDFSETNCSICHVANESLQLVSVGAAYPDSWGPIPGSAEELVLVHGILCANGFSPTDIAQLSGSNCCRHRFMSGVEGKDLLHVSTHGHFQLPSGSKTVDPVYVEHADGFHGPFVAHVLAPLDYSVLGLSGVRAGSTRILKNGGFLAASMVADELDLRSVRICVLSGCDLSVGIRVNAAGVASMQRAMAIAGCQHVVSAAHTVPDSSTRDFMEVWYWKLLSTPDPSSALQLAKTEYSKGIGADAETAAWAGWFVLRRGL